MLTWFWDKLRGPSLHLLVSDAKQTWEFSTHILSLMVILREVAVIAITALVALLVCFTVSQPTSATFDCIINSIKRIFFLTHCPRHNS